MLHKKNYYERLIDVLVAAFAAVMKWATPETCCKYFTKKSSKRAEKFIPSLEEQELAYRSMSPDKAKLHRWSKEFRIKLLNKNDYTLIKDVSSQEELKTLLLNWYSTELCAIACRCCTPTQETIKSFLEKMLTSPIPSEGLERIEGLAEAIPFAFTFLKPEEIFGKGERLIKLMWIILKEKPERALEFVDMLIQTKKVEELKKLVELALAKKLDLSKYLGNFRNNFPEVYSLIRSKCKALGSEGTAYFRTGYYLTRYYLNKEEDRDVRTHAVNGSLTDKADAFAWLSIGYFLLPGNQGVADLFFDEWEFLKERLSEKVFDQLCERLAEEAPTAWSAANAVRLIPLGFKAMAVQHLLGFTEANPLRQFFPFSDWTEEQQKTAVKVLARGKALPLERIEELSYKLQSLALDELEIASELEAIERKEIEEAVKTKLHPETEIVLLTQGTYHYERYKRRKEYVNNFEISDEAFKALSSSKEEDAKELIETHAKKWGLSAQKYRILMNSSRAYLAPQLKQYLQKQA